MYDFNTTITNEGAALLARIIANQENAAFKEARFSETNYVGQEATLTAGTFSGVFKTRSVSSSVIDNTTIKVAFNYYGDSLIGARNLYSIGIVIDDNGTDVLVAVCTSSDPLPLGTQFNDRYAFNVNLAVSSTNNITVTGTTAAVLYDTDVIDTLISTATDKPLSANMGHAIADNLAANENVYGAKNLLEVTALSQTVNDVVFTINADKSITTSGQANAETYLVIGEKKYTAGTYTLTGSSGLSNQYMYGYNVDTAETYVDTGSGVTFTLASENTIRFLIYVQSGASATETYYPMLRDARILDDTFVPYAKTNQQLTNDKAERDDIATINITGTINTTGITIHAGTFFYLNGRFCKALTDIAVYATFTENTNYKVDTVNSGKLNKDWIGFSSQNPISNNGTYDASALVALGKSILFRVIVKTGTYTNYSHEWVIEKFTSSYNVMESFTLETGLIRLTLNGSGIFGFSSANTTECSEIYLDIFFR